MAPDGVDGLGDEVVADGNESYVREHFEIGVGVEMAPEHRHPVIVAHLLGEVFRSRAKQRHTVRSQDTIEIAKNAAVERPGNVNDRVEGTDSINARRREAEGGEVLARKAGVRDQFPCEA